MRTHKRKPAEVERSAERTLVDLEDLLRRLSIEVTYDRRLEGKGGVCRVRGARRIIVQRGLPASEKVDLLLEGLRDVDLSGLDVPESVRERLLGIARARGAAGR